ncbi:hypothetical protein CBOM_07742 [Ceraceosorus bombacis]|uniref:Uncharacterized protein n=1 Tax=Ceraceosorus bombacis TaxID=401625 RepID=A0A0P1BMZ3_9BASI|nr:hypothetical protein CBOM_07742 [Ceraceosorus bombacis]
MAQNHILSAITQYPPCRHRSCSFHASAIVWPSRGEARNNAKRDVMRLVMKNHDEAEGWRVWYFGRVHRRLASLRAG